MDNSFAKHVRRALGAISAAVVFVGLGVSLSGCPVAAELENPDRFDALKGGPTDCNQALPDEALPEINCAYEDAMKDHCARGGCHNATTRSAQLDLTLDTLLIARILEEPAKHASIKCGTANCDPAVVPAACEDCAMCPSGPTDVLLSKASPATSWIMTKMDRFNFDAPTSPPKIGCGTAMPYPPGNTGFTPERKECLAKFFTWIATNGRECDLPMGGSGGGGAGGASGGGGAGSGSGGVGGT
jgi:hypothetical protein